MNKIICTILMLAFVSNVAAADCDYSKIVANADGTYTYSKELHICVGKMKQDLGVAQQQVADLNKAIDLQNLALTKSSDRVKLWMDTSYALEDRLNKIDQLETKNNWVMFGLGVVVTSAAVWGAGQLRH